LKLHGTLLKELLNQAYCCEEDNVFLPFPRGSTVLGEPWLSPYEVSKPLFRPLVGLLGRGVGPSQGLYLHRTTQHTKTRISIHALSGIRTHDNSSFLCSRHVSLILKKITSTKFAYFSKICYHTSFQDSILSGASVAPISKFCASPILALPTAGD
jgi:hypothetical protein